MVSVFKLTYQLSSQTQQLQQGGQTCRWRSPCCSVWLYHKPGPTAKRHSISLKTLTHLGRFSLRTAWKVRVKCRHLPTTIQSAMNFALYIYTTRFIISFKNTEIIILFCSTLSYWWSTLLWRLSLVLIKPHVMTRFKLLLLLLRTAKSLYYPQLEYYWPTSRDF